ncbi:hypothetical protein N7931_17070 [Catenovulum sp. 2E275]|uniref:glycosyltransferase n=1 Tax=Catenovulum sp. 2E275 TaxID=2980497 RepID=UPI0021CEB72E|nr:glycosyltransferase [Catenovulum sp. 2E275]MCU4677338.1 hypothetical protein [Catenovulum sp. 2E275]
MKVVHLTVVHRTKDTRIFYRYCRTLSKMNVDNYLIAPLDLEGFTEGEFGIVEGVQVGFIKKRTNSPFRVFNNIKLIIKHLKCIKPDIVHFHDPELLIIIPILRLYTKKVVYDIHEDNYRNILQKKAVPSILRPMIAYTVRLLEAIAHKTISTVIAERYYQEMFPKAVQALNYPGDYSPETSSILDEYKHIVFGREHKWFLYTGNVTEERGALEQLKILKDDPSYAICYVGYCSGNTYKSIKTWLLDNKIDESRFYLIGLEQFIPQPVIEYFQSKKCWYAGLALFPFNSFYERKELTKFFEYYNNRIVLLCSDFIGWRNFVEEYELGVLYRDGYKEKLSLIEVDFNKHIFTWDSQIQNIEKMYHRLLLK